MHKLNSLLLFSFKLCLNDYHVEGLINLNMVGGLRMVELVMFTNAFFEQLLCEGIKLVHVLRTYNG
jgi:hypothetical protein